MACLGPAIRVTHGLGLPTALAYRPYLTPPLVLVSSFFPYHTHRSRACSFSYFVLVTSRTAFSLETSHPVDMSEVAAAPSVEINDALFCQGHLKEIVSVSRLHLGVNDKFLHCLCY